MLKRVFALQVLNTFNFSKHLKLYLLQVWKKLLKTSNISIYSFSPILCTYTLFQNGGDPGWSGSSCTKTRHQGPRNTRASTRQPQGNGQTYCEFRKKKHQNSEYHPLPTWLRKAKAFLSHEYLHEIQTHQDQSYFYYRLCEVLPQFQSPHNLKLALCIVSGEVEFAYCGPSCTAGKSGFCNHILAFMCPLVWLVLYCLYEQRVSMERIMFDQDHWDTLREKLFYYYLSTFFQ